MTLLTGFPKRRKHGMLGIDGRRENTMNRQSRESGDPQIKIDYAQYNFIIV